MNRIRVNIPHSHTNKSIWSVKDFVTTRKGTLCDFATDSVISKVTLGSTFGHAWGQGILTSFTHGCRPAQHHNGGLPVVFSNVSTQADRILSRRRWMFAQLTSAHQQSHLSGFPPPCMAKEPPLQCSGLHLFSLFHAIVLLIYPNCGTDVFFCNCLVLTAREGCGQTGEVHVRRHCLCCSLLCPRGMRVKVICDEAWGLAILRGSREGSVISGAAPLGGFRPLALWFSLPLRGKSITYYITSHFFPHLHPEEEELKMCWGWLCFRKFSCFFWIVVWK